MRSQPRHLLALCVTLLTLLSTSGRAATSATGTQKLDRQLAAIAEAVAENRADALMSAAISREMFQRNGPFDARWNAAGQVQVYLRYDRNGNPPTAAELAQLGASSALLSRELGVLQAWIPASELTNAAQLPGVLRITVPRYAVTRRISPLGARHYTGSVDTQGDSILGTAQFRSSTGLTGAGSVVGVMSDGDTNASKDVATGDLPSNIWDDPKDAGGSGGFGSASSGDEGTAMLEIIYDLAPGVTQLGFCGPGTDAEYLTCLDDFTGTGGINPTVIVDDLGFPGEPMFTDGDFGTGVQSFANANPSVRLVTAAGNDGDGFWSGQWTSTAAPPVTTSFSITNANGTTNYTQALNFGTAASPQVQLSFTVQGTSEVPTTGDTGNYIVQWNDLWSDTSTTNIDDDYDVFLFDSNNHIIAYNQGTTICGPPELTSPVAGAYCTVATPPSGLTSSQSSPGPQPIQGSSWTNSAANPAQVYLEVFLSPESQTTPGNNIKILVYSQNAFPVFLTPSTAGSVYGQAALSYPTEITVGAVPSSDGVCDEGLTPTNQIEPYSSTGPVVLGTTSGQTQETRMKPDFVAPDGVSTTGVGGFGEPFCGTSAAAPHIAGLLALLGPAYPNRVIYNLLSQYATQFGTANPNGQFGNGLPNLGAMLAAGTFPPPTAVISTPTANVSVTSGSKESFNGACNANGASVTPTLTWSFGSGSGVANSSQANPTVTFATAGSFAVTLSCTSSLGTSSSSVKVTVTAPPSGGGHLGPAELACLLSVLGLSGRVKRRKS